MFKEDKFVREEHYIVSNRLSNYRIQRVCESSFDDFAMMLIWAKEGKHELCKGQLSRIRCPHDRLFIQEHMEELRDFKIFPRRDLEEDLTRKALTAVDKNESFQVEGFNYY